jgi:hypothetical protein
LAVALSSLTTDFRNRNPTFSLADMSAQPPALPSPLQAGPRACPWNGLTFRKFLQLQRPNHSHGRFTGEQNATMKDDDDTPLFYGESLAMLVIGAVFILAVLGAVAWAVWHFLSK